MQDVAATYNVGAISPKGNKAVIAVDEAKGEIYVCKGENGTQRLLPMVQLASSSLPNNARHQTCRQAG